MFYTNQKYLAWILLSPPRAIEPCHWWSPLLRRRRHWGRNRRENECMSEGQRAMCWCLWPAELLAGEKLDHNPLGNGKVAWEYMFNLGWIFYMIFVCFDFIFFLFPIHIHVCTVYTRVFSKIFGYSPEYLWIQVSTLGRWACLVSLSALIALSCLALRGQVSHFSSSLLARKTLPAKSRGTIVGDLLPSTASLGKTIHCGARNPSTSTATTTSQDRCNLST